MSGQDGFSVETIYLTTDSEQQAMARYHDEHEKDPNERVKTSQTLSREFWKGQLHGSGLGRTPIHATHMRPRCSVIPGGMWPPQVAKPIILWETEMYNILTESRNTITIRGTETTLDKSRISRGNEGGDKSVT